ncbi:MAG: CopD family protein [Chloroflexi bacterium]|nr:CopD family protein [Chloroflexota bacterium]
MFDAIILWLHIVGAVVFVGPQVFLAAVALPALRTVGDAKLRQDLTRQITRGFGMLGGIALGLVILTGFYNFYQAQDDGLMDFKRYFMVLNIKMTLAIVVVLLTAAHGFVFGRRLQELMERNAPEAEIAQVRRYSMMTSMATLALSLFILLLAALLASNWSLQGGLR